MPHKEIAIGYFKVFGAHLLAMGISLTDVAEWLKIVSILVAIGYGIWKWRHEFKQAKDGKNKPTH